MKNGRKRLRLFLRRAAVCLCGAAVLCLAAEGIYWFAGRIVPGGGAGVSSAVSARSPSSAALSAAPSSSEPVPVSSEEAPPPSAPPSSAPSEKPPSSAPEKTAGTRWFDDAVLIGDSRTEGLENYDGLGDATYYAVKGLMVDTVYTKAAVKVSGKKLTVMQALQRKNFGKVYIMLGVNELGWSSFDTFLKDYGKVVDDVKKYQPGARVYLQSILPVSAKKSASTTIYTNEKIVHANQAIRRLAQEKKVKYLAVDSALRDASGALPEGASTDGVHLNAEYCKKWCEYLIAHTDP